MDSKHAKNLRAPLQVRMMGPAVDNHRMSINDFVFFTRQLQMALDRVAQVILGRTESNRRGPKPADIRKTCSLEIVDVGPGSLNLVCDLPPKNDLFEDVGSEAVTALVQGIGSVGTSKGTPYGYDKGVLLALRESGKLFDRGITEIKYDFQPPAGGHRSRAVYTPQVHLRLIAMIREPMANQRVLEGRLLMGDFRETAFKCRLHPAVGRPVTCSFEEFQKDVILEALTHHVRLSGEAVEEGGQILELRIDDIELLETEINLKRTGESFFEKSFDINELALQQGVSPVSDFGKLLGDFWPEEEKADAFISQVREWRREGYGRNNYP
jgi:hypothetical protein